MEKKKRFSILKLLLIILCISSVIVSLAVNILFSRNKVPNLFGRHIYVVSEPNPMEGDITTGAALLAKDAGDISVITGDIILCYPADDPDNLTVRSINSITENEDGSQNYYTRDSLHEDNSGSISKEQIVAVCTGYPESYSLGQFINFAKNVKGILCMLVIPSVLLVIFIILGIVSSKSEFEDEDFDFYEYDEPAKESSDDPRPAGKDKPLFQPDPDVLPNPELERKKMSIAENFSQKEVNPDSPYQKEKERTMQFKAQRGSSLSNTMSFTATSTAESSFAARNPNTQSGAAPTADALREEMLRKTAETEHTNTFKAPKAASLDSTVPDNTGILSKSQVAELSKAESAPAESIVKPAAPKQETAAPKKSSTPDISDILGKSAGVRRKKDPSEMSVDDLLKMIEDEKKKL